MPKNVRNGNEPNQIKGLSTGPGASDNASGGGNASGYADAETGLRTDAVQGGSINEDKQKLFPDQPGKQNDHRRKQS